MGIINLSVCLFICLSFYLSVCLSLCLLDFQLILTDRAEVLATAFNRRSKFMDINIIHSHTLSDTHTLSHMHTLNSITPSLSLSLSRILTDTHTHT